MDVLTLRNEPGAADFFPLRTAQLEVYDAKLDATDKPDERIALLNEQSERRRRPLWKPPKCDLSRRTVTTRTCFPSKALCLRIKVRFGPAQRGKQKAKAD